MIADVFSCERYHHLFELSRSLPEADGREFSWLRATPDVARLDTDLAVSPSQTSFAMFYNTRRLAKSDIPRRWLELADPKWKGMAMLVDPRSSATYRAAYNVLRKVHPQLLTRIRELGPRLVESGTPAVQQLAAGTASFAFMGYPSHATPLMVKKAPVQWATIEGPELTRGVWVGAAKGPHPNAARLFIHFFTSDDGLPALLPSERRLEVGTRSRRYAHRLRAAGGRRRVPSRYAVVARGQCVRAEGAWAQLTLVTFALRKPTSHEDYRFRDVPGRRRLGKLLVP